MADEKYILLSGGAPTELNQTFRPSTLMPTALNPNLVRGRGSTRIYDLSDGLPPPVPIVLTGTVDAETEDELAKVLATLRAAAQRCTMLSRNNRPGISIQGASMVAIPIDDDSSQAQVTLSFIPTNVPQGGGLYDW